MPDAPERIRAWVSRGLKRWDEGTGKTQYVLASVADRDRRERDRLLEAMRNIARSAHDGDIALLADEAIAEIEGGEG